MPSSTVPFLDPAVKGTFPEELVTIIKELDMIPEHEAEDLVIIQENTIDLLGINYYQPRRIMAKKHRSTTRMVHYQMIILIIMINLTKK